MCVFFARSLCYSQIEYPFILGNKKINLQGVWQVSKAADKAELAFGTLQAAAVPSVIQYLRHYNSK